MFKTKIPIQLKSQINEHPKPQSQNLLIDLRKYSGTNVEKTNKQKILELLQKLIDHTDQQVQASSGDDKGKNQHRLTTFKKAINSIQSYPSDITSGSQAKNIKGIGPGLAKRIDEILTTGTLKELNENITIDLQTQLIKELTTVTGIGEAHAKKFIEQGVIGVDDLIKKVAEGVIKITHHIGIGLQYYYDFQTKIPFEEIVQLTQIMRPCILELYPNVIIEVCGSHRRKKLLSGDIDVLMTCPEIKTEDDLIKTKIPYLKNIVKKLQEIGFIVDDLTSQGSTKYMGVCMKSDVGIGRRIDIRFVQYESYYPALLYFTGSMMTNKLMRTIALEKGYTLNEYGLYKYVAGQKGEKVVANSEKEIFDILGIQYLDPTEREIDS